MCLVSHCVKMIIYTGKFLGDFFFWSSRKYSKCLFKITQHLVSKSSSPLSFLCHPWHFSSLWVSIEKAPLFLPPNAAQATCSTSNQLSPPAFQGSPAVCAASQVWGVHREGPSRPLINPSLSKPNQHVISKTFHFISDISRQFGPCTSFFQKIYSTKLR